MYSITCSVPPHYQTLNITVIQYSTVQMYSFTFSIPPHYQTLTEELYSTVLYKYIVHITFRVSPHCNTLKRTVTAQYSTEQLGVRVVPRYDI